MNSQGSLNPWDISRSRVDVGLLAKVRASGECFIWSEEVLSWNSGHSQRLQPLKKNAGLSVCLGSGENTIVQGLWGCERE